MGLKLIKRIKIDVEYEIDINEDKSTTKQIEQAEENITKTTKETKIDNGKVNKVTKK